LWLEKDFSFSYLADLCYFAMNLLTDILSHDDVFESKVIERTNFKGRRNTERRSEQKELPGNLVMLGNVPARPDER